MSSSQIVSPRSNGAGRFIDFVFPDPYQTTYVAGGRDRIGDANSGITSTSFGGTASTFLAETGDGVDHVRHNNGATFGGSLTYGLVKIRTNPTNAYPGIVYRDVCEVYRVYAVLQSAGGLATGNADYGFQIVNQQSGSAGGIFDNGQDGIAFNWQTVNSIRLLTRRGGVLTNDVTIAAGSNGLDASYDSSLAFHTFEWRIVQSNKAPTTLTWLIDGVPLTGLPASMTSWATGTGLPASTMTNNKQGFAVQTIINLANQAYNIYQVRIIGAGTLADTF